MGVVYLPCEAWFEADKYVKQAVTFKAEMMGMTSDNRGSESSPGSILQESGRFEAGHVEEDFNVMEVQTRDEGDGVT